MNKSIGYGIELENLGTIPQEGFSLPTSFEEYSENELITESWFDVAALEQSLDNVLGSFKNQGKLNESISFARQLAKMYESSYVRLGHTKILKDYTAFLAVWEEISSQKQIKEQEANKLSLDQNERQVIECFLNRSKNLPIETVYVFKNEESRVNVWIISELDKPDDKLCIFETFNEVQSEHPRINYDLVVFTKEEIKNVELPSNAITYQN